jgi:hypothetical protein
MANRNSAHPASKPSASQDMQATIDLLAKEMACDAAYVAEVYRSEHSRLTDAARLQDFVPLFAARYTRDRILRDRRGPR